MLEGRPISRSVVDFSDDLTLECQSGQTHDAKIFSAETKAKYENVQFSDQHDPYAYEMETVMDETRRMEDQDDATLAKFFSRPVKIAEQEWSTSTSLNFDLDPWSLYFNNPRVSNRLTNFYLLRANLRVKVVINGNGFQYGRMLVNYLPLPTYDTMSTNAALLRQDLVQASQRPHIFLNPTLSTGGEMKLPMFYHNNYMRIPDGDWREMGRLFFRTINQLRHANGASDVVTITVYAWAEDVAMSVLTSVDQFTLEPQSGEIDEANAKGVISGPATTVSKYAAYAAGVPYIAPYARATEIASKAIASVAKMFGYSRPSITKAPEPYRPQMVSSLACTTVPDNAAKLTVDDKQELTIDPRISGVGGVDPLNIVEIARRESYLTTFQWNIGTAPDTLLWNSRIDPALWAESPGTTNAIHLPACAMAALPFDAWKGTIKFRFQVVCSSFHKGRLRIVYDPRYLADNTYLGFSEYNTNYLKVVDLAEEQDFTIEIGTAQHVSYLKHMRPGVDSVTDAYGTSRFTGTRAFGNGVIGVFVVNELTTPSDVVTNDIEINVYVSAGEDFEVANPNADIFQYTFAPPPLEPQSGEVVPDGFSHSAIDTPQQDESTIIGLPPKDSPKLNSVFYGETIVSFRSLLKRYMLWSAIGKNSTVPVVCAGRRPAFPYHRGYVPGAVDAVAGGTAYNYVNTVLLHWVRAAFSGSRGSIRYKFVPRGAFDGEERLEVSRVSRTNGFTNFENSCVALPQYPNAKASRFSAVCNPGVFGNSSICPEMGAAGIAIAHANVNACLEVEIPYQESVRFEPGKRINRTRDGVGMNAFDYRAFFPTGGNGTDTAVFDVYVAAGEDFQTYFFSGMPRVYFEPTPPP